MLRNQKMELRNIKHILVHNPSWVILLKALQVATSLFRSAYCSIVVVPVTDIYTNLRISWKIWPAFKLGSNESKAIACLTLELLDFE